ncbi:hypothetical protein [uncultured Selenomonas sp.]|uniref:hypothetical protein n=1 Tax=uncultured Selenomonas sp. TaxID=159275 RepID=UPI0025E0F774|nr:hypothetical protein [uncultured Selenomonas sp.]
MEQDSHTTPTTQCGGFLKHLHAAQVVRSFTATALMVVGALAPFTLVHGFAAPQDIHPRAAIAEIANVSKGTTLEENELFSERQRKDNEKGSRDLAKKLLAQAAAVESSVTQDMKRLQTAEAKLLGLDYRMKSEDSLTRKIESDAAEKNISLERAANGMHDVLRYTLAIDAERYQETVPAVLEDLTASGYRIEKFNNAWGGKYYQGINVQLTSPTGVPVELQLHTPQSFAIKQASHGVYEIRRSADATQEEKAKAKRLSIAYNVQVKMPQGADALIWPAA